MSQILDPVPRHEAERAVLCAYVNATSKIQVARIRNIPNWYFERVVFPGQRLIFEAMPEAYLEIHSGMMASSILSDRIPCDRLVDEAEPERPLEFYSAPAEFTPPADLATVEHPLDQVDSSVDSNAGSKPLQGRVA